MLVMSIWLQWMLTFCEAQEIQSLSCPANAVKLKHENPKI
jgi:hypothetical protein